jgi:hypothetical protein
VGHDVVVTIQEKPGSVYQPPRFRAAEKYCRFLLLLMMMMMMRTPRAVLQWLNSLLFVFRRRRRDRPHDVVRVER